MVYLVIWSGGFESPSYWSTKDKAKAVEQAQHWASENKKSEDIVELIAIDEDGSTSLLPY